MYYWYLLSSVVVVICDIFSMYSTIEVWDLAAALDASSSSDTLCITTLEV